MASWLETHAPRKFSDLAMSDAIVNSLEKAAMQANPPHLILAGPAGVGKTASWRLIARQILGPGWKSTTHILQARDLVRTAGAMNTFEEFLRPGGTTSGDTLAGRSSLDAFDNNLTQASADDIPPAGVENSEIHNEIAPVSRLIISAHSCSEALIFLTLGPVGPHASNSLSSTYGFTKLNISWLFRKFSDKN